jgi:pimeloyl-ACP methyl ester carboxylesterase
MRKVILLLIVIVSGLPLLAQNSPPNFIQTVDVSSYQDASFRLEGYLFIEDKARDAGASPLAVTSSGSAIIKYIFDRYSMETFKPNVWNRVSVSGDIEKADRISIGTIFSGKGKYYFDDFKLFVKKGDSEIEIPLINSDFEGDSIEPWMLSNFNDKSKLRLTRDKFKSGRQSVVIDNSIIESESYGNNTKIGKYANVNGIKLYYEIYGSGEPLLLLHGNNESIASFSAQIPELSKKYLVVAVDSRGQGNSTTNDSKLSYELFAGDINGLINNLQLKNVNILGWSDGANIALILAMRHSGRIKKIAAMAAVLYNDSTSIPNEINAIIKEQVSEMEKRRVDSMDMYYRLKKLLLTDPNIHPDSLKQISVPALILAGENDVVREAHTKLIAEKIPRATLKIFKNTGHDAPKEIPDEFNKTVMDFFEKR